MFKVTLYINDTKADTFKDENIRIVDSLKNIRDIGSVFTTFSQSFSLPASKVNNGIFRHYYNPSIVQDPSEGGFDARLKASAEIKVNGATYKTGRLKLNTVKLKNGKVESYNVVFLEGLVDLKDSIGDNDLSSLQDLNQYNHPYTESLVRDGLELGLADSGGTMVRSATAEVLYPLITWDKRYIFDSSLTPSFQDTRENLALQHTQLKPAIKAIHIIEAIENDYGVTFTRDFFTGSPFDDLYMWLHRGKGGVEGVDDNVTFIEWDDFSFISGTDTIPSDGVFQNKAPSYSGSGTTSWYLSYDFTITGTGNYRVVVKNYENGTTEVLYDESNMSGNKTINIDIVKPPIGVFKNYKPVIEVTAEAGITQIGVSLDAEKSLYDWYDDPTPSQPTGTYDIAAITPVNQVVMSSNMPDQKIMDFLSGLFKLYNLIARKRPNGDIYVEDLDTYYAAGNNIDLTEYIDWDAAESEAPVPYNSIVFEFSDTDTFLRENREVLLGESFGDLKYSLSGEFSFKEYKIKVPFTKLLFELMEDINLGSFTNNLFGYFVNEDQEPTKGDPLLFYNYGTQTFGDIDWADGSNSSSYQRAGNVAPSETETLNFGAEINEFTLRTIEESIFKTYYESYVEEIYGASARIVKYTAYLPASFILTYDMNDRIIINGRSHKISSIEIDLIDGKAEMELITE